MVSLWNRDLPAKGNESLLDVFLNLGQAKESIVKWQNSIASEACFLDIAAQCFLIHKSDMVRILQTGILHLPRTNLGQPTRLVWRNSQEQSTVTKNPVRLLNCRKRRR